MTTSANGGGIRHDQQQREIYTWISTEVGCPKSKKSACVTRMVVDLYCHGGIYRCPPNEKKEKMLIFVLKVLKITTMFLKRVKLGHFFGLEKKTFITIWQVRVQTVWNFINNFFQLFVDRISNFLKENGTGFCLTNVWKNAPFKIRS